MRSTSTHITLLRALHGDQRDAAWEAFVDRYGELIRTMARRQGLHDQDAEDVLQDVLLTLSRTLPGFEYDPAQGRFRSFLKTIVVRTVFARFRQKRRASTQEALETLMPGSVPGFDEQWEDEWRQYHLRRAMQRATAESNESDVAAFRAYAVEQRSANEVSEALGISIDRVYQAKSRVLARVKELVAEQIDEEG